jgi:hypothetical protein
MSWKLGNAATLILVRPDQHIGLIAPLNNIAVLCDYLATFFASKKQSVLAPNVQLAEC